MGNRQPNRPPLPVMELDPTDLRCTMRNGLHYLAIDCLPPLPPQHAPGMLAPPVVSRSQRYSTYHARVRAMRWDLTRREQGIHVPVIDRSVPPSRSSSPSAFIYRQSYGNQGQRLSLWPDDWVPGPEDIQRIDNQELPDRQSSSAIVQATLYPDLIHYTNLFGPGHLAGRWADRLDLPAPGLFHSQQHLGQDIGNVSDHRGSRPATPVNDNHNSQSGYHDSGNVGGGPSSTAYVSSRLPVPKRESVGYTGNRYQRPSPVAPGTYNYNVQPDSRHSGNSSGGPSSNAYLHAPPQQPSDWRDKFGYTSVGNNQYPRPSSHNYSDTVQPAYQGYGNVSGGPSSNNFAPAQRPYPPYEERQNYGYTSADGRLPRVSTSSHHYNLQPQFEYFGNAGRVATRDSYAIPRQPSNERESFGGGDDDSTAALFESDDDSMDLD